MKHPDIQPGMNLSDKQVFAMVKSLGERFNGKGGRNDSKPDTSTVSGRIAWRRQHLHNDEAVDPVRSDPWNDGTKSQSDLPRRVTQEWVARLTAAQRAH